MAHRLRSTCRALDADTRSEIGLSYLKAVFDLPRAYRVATKFHPTLQARPYPGWRARFDALNEHDRREIRSQIARLGARPRMHVLISSNEAGPEAVRATLASVRRQLYPELACSAVGFDSSLGLRNDADREPAGPGDGLCIVAPDATGSWLAQFNESLARENAGDWVMLLRAGDVLPEHATYWFVCEALAQPDAVILYSDDHTVDDSGEPRQHHFKPDWSLTHLRSTNYIGNAVVFRGSAVAAAGGLTPDCLRHGSYDLILRVIDAVGERVVHIPAVLFDRRDGEGNGAAEGGRGDPWHAEKLKEHLQRRGIAAEVTETLPGCRRVRHVLPARPPLISIIVPTRDALALIRQCAESILAKTTYPRFELLVVDNQSANPQALAYLGDLARRSAVRVIRYDRPFNYSAINNFAVRQARGEMLCLLNNDTEVISPDWLEEMAGHLLQDKVGAVGARLLYADGRVQHGGVTVGPGGCADHLHADLPRAHPGYCNRAVIAQELSAVTAACMLTWKHLFEQLGGLDEENLPIAFNDVDYCLRLGEAGYRIIYTAHAELHHHESASRGPDTTWRERRRERREINYMRTRWRERMQHDPYYNPNLSYDQPNFTLNWTPRVKKPWL
jgi:GT2 family glycosyltransferase